ncbi:ADP compounds hydrolase NudE, partial [Salmonella enterica subsp. enterica serovar Typhimurium var. 5-]|nr:ADP compounds hydrolase NudE [Salmonella enterica subsp. enterica serovar Typhimurium var. 5-]
MTTDYTAKILTMSKSLQKPTI